MKNFLLFVTASTLGLTLFAQDPNPQLFQTWYLYSVSDDFGDTQYYYGQDAPQLTINPDLSFSAMENCWEMSGDFVYVEGDLIFDFYLEPINYQEACVLGGINGYILKLLLEVNQIIGCFLDENSISELSMQSNTLFSYTLKNQVTLSVGENSFLNIAIVPNPANESISITGLNNTVESIEIVNIAGAIIRTFNTPKSTTLDISSLDAGIYFLRITSERATVVEKFLKL
jgi:hypothetical protein